jgi:hypothetical protein
MVVTQNLVTSVLEMGILGGVGQKAGDCFEVRDERKPSRSMAADTTRLHLPELGARRRAGWAGLNLGEMRQTGGACAPDGQGSLAETREQQPHDGTPPFTKQNVQSTA